MTRGEFTVFPDVHARRFDLRNMEWTELAGMLAAPTEGISKKALPLLKLATFGDVLTNSGSLRHDENVDAVTGVEGDYDAGVMSFAEAVEKLRAAGVACVVYTTPSHTVEKPRWRVIAPLSAPIAPSERRTYVARLDKALGGILASESYTLSQSFYFGKVKGVPFESQAIEGEFIDRIEALASAPSDAKDASPKAAPKGEHRGGNSELLAELLNGDDVHGNALAITARLISRGMRPDDVRAMMVGLSYQIDEARPGRGIELRGAELDRMISGAVAKGFDDPVSQALMQHATQDNIALVFARNFAGKLLYVHDLASWFEWDGTRWRRESTDLAFDYARTIARSRNTDGKTAVASAAFCKGVETFCRADRTFARTASLFDGDNYLLNTPAGTVDLRTGDIRPHNPGDHITMATSVSPDPAGGAVFRKFLSEITCGDADLEYFHQISLGAILSGAVESHWLMFWTGAGRNGKNTLGDLVAYVIGDYAKKIPSSTLMAKHFEAHPTELASLKGVRLAISSEVSDGDHWHESRINELTGDATISARFMRGDFFEFARTHKHLIYGNHRPQLRSITDALRARIKIVPFKASFAGREDPELPEKLKAEAAYVLQWLIEGHWAWYVIEGMRLPACAAVEAESAEYFASQSTIDAWITQRLDILTNDERSSSQCPQASILYSDYSDWKKNRGDGPVSMTRWSETMTKKFSRVNSNGVRYRGCDRRPYAWGDI